MTTSVILLAALGFAVSIGNTAWLGLRPSEQQRLVDRRKTTKTLLDLGVQLDVLASQVEALDPGKYTRMLERATDNAWKAHRAMAEAEEVNAAAWDQRATSATAHLSALGQSQVTHMAKVYQESVDNLAKAVADAAGVAPEVAENVQDALAGTLSVVPPLSVWALEEAIRETWKRTIDVFNVTYVLAVEMPGEVAVSFYPTTGSAVLAATVYEDLHMQDGCLPPHRTELVQLLLKDHIARVFEYARSIPNSRQAVRSQPRRTDLRTVEEALDIVAGGADCDGKTAEYPHG